MTVVDTIRAVATYLIAFTVVLGGGAIIYVSRADPSATDTVAIMAGFVGSALTFVFGQEVQTRTARQAASQTYAAGPNGHAAPGAG
jgi:membrane protein DedA with SNARE-associated domain